jgi:proline iminopeptidase
MPLGSFTGPPLISRPLKVAPTYAANALPPGNALSAPETGVPVSPRCGRYLRGAGDERAGGVAGRDCAPRSYRAVLFDQRGCGRSRPLADGPGADLATNTTGHLVADMERLRNHLGIDRWVVVGVSWGSTLALVYTQRHPQRVRGVVLGGVTAGTRRELTWITHEMGRVFPAEWEDFVAVVPEAERDGDLAGAYARLLTSPDGDVREEAARRWCAWEDTHVSLMPGWTPWPRYDDATFRCVFARLVTHYWSNDCFLAEHEVVRNMDRIAVVPGVLVHGRYDISSPLETAWTLHKRWPASRLAIVRDAGHGGGGFGEALASAIDEMRDLD